MNSEIVSNYEEQFFDDKEEKPDAVQHHSMCPECNIPCITFGHDQWECSQCGNITEYSTLEKTSRFSNETTDAINPLLPKSSHCSIIIPQHTSNFKMKRTQKVHSWSAMTYKERCLNNIFQEITLCSLNARIVSSIVKLAHQYYTIISEEYVARGTMRKGIIAACLFMACKKLQVPRTCTEIATIFKIDPKWVTKGNKKFLELWHLAGKEDIVYQEECPSFEYLSRFCSHLLDDHSHILKVSIFVRNQIKKHNLLTQNTPTSIAAASIFMAIQLINDQNTKTITRTHLSKVTNTSHVTITKCYKELNQHDIWKEFPR